MLDDHVRRIVEGADGIEATQVRQLRADDALDKVVDVGRDEYSVTDLVNGVARSSHPLKGTRNAFRRAHHDDRVDVADVESEFEAGGTDHAAQLSALQAILHILPNVSIERRMVTLHRRTQVGKRELETVGNSLRPGSGIREHQGRPISLDDPSHVRDHPRPRVSRRRIRLPSQGREHLDD